MKKLWKVYYDDGSVLSNKDYKPEELPGVGVQVIVQADDRHGWEFVEGKSFFVWDDRGKGYKWWGADREGFFDYLFNKPGKKVALLGRFIEDDAFDEIQRTAMKDKDFEPKTGFKARERKS
jgi:hypothetical protein